MWIQVRTMDGKQTHRVDNLSKLTKVDELRVKIMELFNVEPEKQRLFYRGKQVRQRGCGYYKACDARYKTDILCVSFNIRWRMVTPYLITMWA